MIARKIDAMHRLYGTVSGKKCGNCPHLIEGYYHDRKLMKCKAYGLSHSEATDWRKKWDACRLIGLPLPENGTVLDRIRWQRERVEQQVKGQISMEEIINESVQ